MADLNHSAVIDLWPSVQAFGAAIGEKYDTVLKWRTRNSIPSWKWPTVVDAAKAAGFGRKVTIQGLSASQPPRRERAA